MTLTKVNTGPMKMPYVILKAEGKEPEYEITPWTADEKNELFGVIGYGEGRLTDWTLEWFAESWGKTKESVEYMAERFYKNMKI